MDAVGQAPSRAPRMSAQARREQILDVTKQIVGERGFHAVTIEGVAREAGITRPVVYGHFHDLTGLLEALVEREGERALAQLARIVPTGLGDGDDPLELLIGALRGFLESVLKEPITWQLVLMPQEGAPELLRKSIVRDRAAVTVQLARLAGGALGGGAPASPDPELTGLMMQAISEESARLLLADPARFGIDRLCAHARWALGSFGRAV